MPVAVVAAIFACVAPLVLATLIDPAHAAGRALWEWSAAGGPTVRASYRFDGIAAIGVAVGAAYAGAGLFGAARATTRHPLLPSAILGLGLVFFALVVTDARRGRGFAAAPPAPCDDAGGHHRSAAAGAGGRVARARRGARAARAGRGRVAGPAPAAARRDGRGGIHRGARGLRVDPLGPPP